MTVDIAERFAKDTANHSVAVKLDDGVYRHLVCSNNGSSIYRFEIVTWPGYLAYVGDMGDFTFRRLRDMFEFFRGKEINPSYWGEKVVAACRDGITEWDQDTFRAAVLSDARSHLELDDDEEIFPEVLAELRSILSSENEHEALVAVGDYDGNSVDFSDFWEHDCTVFTHRFLWCCHAIVWAINKYDEAKEALNATR
jgi:hypothetical protein